MTQELSRRDKRKAGAIMLGLLAIAGAVDCGAIALTDASTAWADAGHVVADAFSPVVLILASVIDRSWFDDLLAPALVAGAVLMTAALVLVRALGQFATAPERPGWLIAAGLIRAGLDLGRLWIASRLRGRLGRAIAADAGVDAATALLPAVAGALALFGLPGADPWLAVVVGVVIGVLGALLLAKSAAALLTHRRTG